MWTTEGEGRVPPTPVVVRLESADFVFAKLVAERRNAYRRYKRRADQWGRGLLDTADPTYVGTVCEVAFAKWVRKRTGVLVSVDDADRPGGDPGWDFDVVGYKVQVKGAVAAYDDLLVRDLEMAVKRCHLFVRAHYPPRGLDDPGAVALCGWAFKRDVKDRNDLHVGRAGNMNYRHPPVEFSPMSALADLFIARKHLWEEGA